MGVTRVFSGCYNVVTRVFQGSNKGSTRVLQGVTKMGMELSKQEVEFCLFLPGLGS